jgi:hypothetical protein
MTPRSRWAALASAIGALLIGLPTAAQGDPSPTEAPPTTGTTPGVPGFPGIPGFNCAAPTSGNSTSTTLTTGTTTPSTSGTTLPASIPSTSPALNGTPSFPVGTTPTAGGIASPPLPCIDAAGNVYIFYVITVTNTTTTTTTPITAPILAANGSLSVTGDPPSGFGSPASSARKFGSTSAAKTGKSKAKSRKSGKSKAGRRRLICVAPVSKQAGTHASRPTNKRAPRTQGKARVHLMFACRSV